MLIRTYKNCAQQPRECTQEQEGQNGAVLGASRAIANEAAVEIIDVVPAVPVVAPVVPVPVASTRMRARQLQK